LSETKKSKGPGNGAFLFERPLQHSVMSMALPETTMKSSLLIPRTSTFKIKDPQESEE